MPKRYFDSEKELSLQLALAPNSVWPINMAKLCNQEEAL